MVWDIGTEYHGDDMGVTTVCNREREELQAEKTKLAEGYERQLANLQEQQQQAEESQVLKDDLNKWVSDVF